MATLHVIILYLLLSLTFSSTAATTTADATRPKRYAERILRSSIARSIYLLSQKTSKTHYHDHDDHIQPSLSFLGTINSLFYVNFSVGQPPGSQLAVMDTGSDLIRINCNPKCENCGPVLDPLKSSTFSKSPCNSTFCDACSPKKECEYIIEYVEGTDSDGIIATEQFSIETSDAGRTTVNNVVFGYESTGVFGLGLEDRTEFSIIKLLGATKFRSVGNVDDMEYKHNRLVLCEGAMVEGYSTPLEISEDLYYITLEGVKILFRRTRSNNGVFIDSGGAYTWLTPTACQTLRREIQQLGFPVMTLHFSDGADLVMDALSMFVQMMKSSVFCLAVGPSDVGGEDKKDMSIIGMLAQKNYN
ncbi:hypothetical protein ACOSQ2_012843 [Xanthoceras sorbifolium]